MNKIFIRTHEITMSEKRFAVLYCNRKGSSIFSVRKSYANRTVAMKKFMLGVEYLKTDYDGYSYVALMHKVTLAKTENAMVWKVEAFGDNVGVRHGW